MGFAYGSMKVPFPTTAAAAIACAFSVLIALLKRFLAYFISALSSSSVVVDDQKYVSASAAEMVKSKLPVIRYKEEEDGDGDEETVCSICLCCVRRGHLIRRLSNCRHRFHSDCLDKWVGSLQVNCPNCRSLL